MARWDDDDLPAGEVWDRLPNEGERAYQAFTTFLDLGVGRSINAAYRARSGRDPGASYPAAPGGWREWAKQFRWKERAVEWDRAERRQLRIAREKAREAELQVFRDDNIRRIQVSRQLLGGLTRILAANLSRLASAPPELNTMQVISLLGGYNKLSGEIGSSEAMVLSINQVFDLLEEKDRGK
ncbi:MAG: hypothetical protein JWQ02_1038 [Capsulimonas sp.]|nr:hypothetical protein [Capsulimonas sp.]